MEIKLLILLVFAPSSLRAQYAPSGFDYFTSCLRENGLKNNQIIPKGNSTEYANLNYQFRVKPATVYPLAFVLPSREVDVLVIVNCGRKFRIQLTPRCGGHQDEKFAYGNANSVVVDMRKMDGVSLHRDMRLATVEAGSLLGPMAWKLWTTGKKFIPIGLCPVVGVSGLATGGGHGYYTRQFGLTSDQVEEITIVVADGNLLHVNKYLQPDLFWALRGGGGASFGIITKFVFRVYSPPPRMFQGILDYDLSHFEKIFQIWQTALISTPRTMTPNFRTRNGYFELMFFDTTGTAKEFATLERILPPAKSRNTTTFEYPDFVFHAAKNYGGSLKTGVKLDSPADYDKLQPGSSSLEDSRTKSFYVSKVLGPWEINQFSKLFQERPESVRVRLEAYGGSINDVLPHETAFVHRRPVLYNARATLAYANLNAAEQKAGEDWLNKFFIFGLHVFHSKGTYQNYPDSTMRDVRGRYYGANLERLVQTKRRYDPTNYFRNPESINP